VLLFWHAWVTFSGVNAIVLPRPTDVFVNVVAEPGIYLSNGAQTLGLAAAALALVMAIGTLVAYMTWA